MEGVSIEDGDQERITELAGTENLNQDLINAFLSFVNTKGNLGFTWQVACDIESLFPPADSYFEAEDVPSLDILSTFVRAVNSWLYVSRGKNIKVNPRSFGITASIREEDILNVSDLSDGFNKVYNVIEINELKTYSDKTSIDQYDTRKLDIQTYAAPSEALAQSYLDYYKEPKKECNLDLKLNNRTLGFRVGSGLSVSIRETSRG